MALLDEHRDNLSNLNVLATQEVVAVLDGLEGRPIPEMAFYLRDALPAIGDQYSAVAEELALEYYAAARLEANVGSTYEPTRASIDIDTPLQSAVGYSVANLTKGSTWDAVMSTLTGTMQRVVNGAARETISYNIVTDPDGTVYERVPSANACAFCLTMAAVAEYSTNDYFSKFHDNCHCVSRPVFTGQERTELPIYDSVREAHGDAYYAIRNERDAVYPVWRQEWEKAGGRMGKNLTRDFLKAYPDLAFTTENYLRHMRSATGWR